MKNTPFLTFIVLIMITFANCDHVKDNTSLLRWDNDLILPSPDNINQQKGVAGAFCGLIEDELFIAGGANFPEGFPWTGGKKTWWSTLYSAKNISSGNPEWKVYNNFLGLPLGYGVSIQLDRSVLLIGGCDSEKCYAELREIKQQDDSLCISTEEYPPLPVPLANAAGTICNNKIYIAGGQESMMNEKSSTHFFMLDLNKKEEGWIKLPSWPGPSRGYAVCASQNEKVYLFSGRSYGPNEETIMHTDGYEYNPDNGCWKAIKNAFPIMAGTALAYKDDKILFMGGVEKILPTEPHHPGFNNTVRLYDIEKNTMETLATSPYPIPVTTSIASIDENIFYICSGEIKPGIRTPHILKGTIE